MASPAFGSAGTQLQGSASTMNVDVPDSVAAGDIIVVTAFVDTAGATVTGLATDFAQAPESPVSGENHKLYVMWKRATGADSTAGTYDFTLSTSTYRNAQAIRYTGAAGSGDPWDVTNTASSGSSNVSATPAVSDTTTVADTLLVWAATNWSGGSWTPPTDFTERRDSGDGVCTVADKTQAAAGATGSISGTSTSTDKSVAWLGALKPSTASSTGEVFPTAGASVSEAPWSDEAWNTPGNVVSDNASTANVIAASFDSGDQTTVLKATGFDFSSIPDGSTILGVTARVNAWFRSGQGSGSLDLCQLLDTTGAKVGTNQCATPVALTTTTSTIITKGGAADLWGNSLTTSWVKDADFGIALGCLATAANADVDIDYVTLEITYEAAATPVEGVGAGAYDFTATGAGVPETFGTAASALTFGSTAAGVPDVQGAAVGAYTFTGTASGQTGAPPVEGQAQGSYTFTGSASGTPETFGAASGSLGFTATAAGVDRAVGAAQGSFAFGSTASGRPRSLGAAAVAVTFDPTAAGVPGVHGVAAASHSFTATGSGFAGTPPVTGQGVGTYTFGSTANGIDRATGTAAVSFTFTSTAAGIPDVHGTALAPFTVAATAIGQRKTFAQAASVLAFTGSGSAFVGEPPVIPDTFELAAVADSTYLGALNAPLTLVALED